MKTVILSDKRESVTIARLKVLQYCLEERLGEYKTAQPMNYTPVVKLGDNCSDEVYKFYLAFADRIERDYNVRMEVKR